MYENSASKEKEVLFFVVSSSWTNYHIVPLSNTIFLVTFSISENVYLNKFIFTFYAIFLLVINLIYYVNALQKAPYRDLILFYFILLNLIE
jgi:hypothetical protein